MPLMIEWDSLEVYKPGLQVQWTFKEESVIVVFSSKILYA